MFQFALPLLLVLIAGAVVVTQRHHHHDRLLRAGHAGAAPAAPVMRGPTPMGSPAGVPSGTLAADLDRWVAAGLITRDEADRILEHEQQVGFEPVTAPPRPARRIPVVAEALGYLGGILGVVGVSVVVANYWSDIGAAGRLGLTGAVTALFVVAGAIVREEVDPALQRMRWFLWLLATASAAVFGGVAAHDLFDADHGRTVALGGALAVTVVSAALWQWKARPVQEFTCLVGALVALGLGGFVLADAWLAGMLVWLLAAAMVVLGARHLMPHAWIPLAVGTVGMTAGALMLSDEWQWFGLLAGTASVLAVLSLMVLPRLTFTFGERFVGTSVALVCMLAVLPSAIGYFAEGAGVATGLVVWAGGAALLALAMRRVVRTPVAVLLAGGAAVIGGAAVTAVQSVAFATIFGMLTAVALLGLGTLPGGVLLSVLGSVGLLVNVPWAIAYWFPGKGRVPLLIAVCGLLMVLVAVLLTRLSGRIRKEVHN